MWLSIQRGLHEDQSKKRKHDYQGKMYHMDVTTRETLGLSGKMYHMDVGTNKEGAK